MPEIVTYAVPPGVRTVEHLMGIGVWSAVDVLDVPPGNLLDGEWCETVREGRAVPAPGRFCNCGAMRLVWQEGDTT